MTDQTELALPKIGDFHLVRQIRREGPFELFEAMQANLAGARVVALRRPVVDLAKNEPARRVLGEATQIAKRVAHHNVLLCHGCVELDGQLVQTSEYAHKVDLAMLVANAKTSNTPVELPLAVWIARQMCEAIVHAESLGFVHRNLAPEHVHPSGDGAIKIDYGISRPADADQTATPGFGDSAYEAPKIASPSAQAPIHPDVYACAAILFELLTGTRYIDALRERQFRAIHVRELRADVPPALEAILARTLDLELKDPPRDAKAFASAIERVFYVELDGDDAKHGEASLRARLGSIAPELALAKRPEILAEAGLPSVTDVREKGAFTQMLEERNAPVVPKPLAFDDHDSNVFDPGSSSWVAGKSLPEGFGIVRDTHPTEAHTAKLDALQPEEDAPKEDPTTTSTPPEKPKKKWRWAWFAFGFLATLACAKMYGYVANTIAAREEEEQEIRAVLPNAGDEERVGNGVDGGP